LKSYYGESKTDEEITKIVDDYMSGSEPAWELIKKVASDVDKMIVGYYTGREKNDKIEQAKTLKENELSTKENIHGILSDIITGDSDKKWYERIDNGQLKELADYFGISVKELKNLPYEEIEKRFVSLGTSIDETEIKFDALQ